MPITARAAARHEAVYLRLQALLKQVQALAARRPEALVPEVVRILAEGVLFDARPFLPQQKSRRGWPTMAVDQVGLAVQLGQMQAGLDAFEITHTSWNASQQCFCWLACDSAELPVRRLRPKLAVRAEATAAMQQLREKLARRIDARAEAHYDRGRRDGALEASRAAADNAAIAEPQTYPRLRQPG